LGQLVFFICVSLRYGCASNKGQQVNAKNEAPKTEAATELEARDF